MSRTVPALILGAGALFVVVGLVALNARSSARPITEVPKPSPLAHADARYAAKPKEATREYAAFVERHVASRDPEVRDRVGAARMRLGYLAARRRDLTAARTAFLAAARTKGTGAAGAFGTVDDQAAYQAAVCLVAEGKKTEAIREFEGLLRERPLSPLSRAAYRRLAMLNGGASRLAWDALVQAAVAKQEARARFETSVCGPKAIAHALGGDYRTIAKLCGTGDAGTTIEGMRRGLKDLGHESWAARLDRRDLARAKLPAILLEGDHYVVLERLDGDAVTLWDPRFGAAQTRKLPGLDDPDFSVAAILLARPEGL